jgi:hypothetical protein
MIARDADELGTPGLSADPLTLFHDGICMSQLTKATPKRRKSMGGHENPVMLTDVWLTPPELLEALGPFDLDPCAPVNRPWDMASRHYTKDDNGLRLPWSGRVWCNPPYGSEARHWLLKLSAHGRGTALIFARTETRMFFDAVWKSPTVRGLLFIEGRLHFYKPDGTRAPANAGAPSVLVAYGADDAERLRTSTISGYYVKIEG